MFCVFSGLNWAVFLEVSHVAAAQWQLELESSEVTVSTGLSARSRAGLSTRMSAPGFSVWLELLTAWWLGSRRSVPREDLLLSRRPKQKLQGFL